MLRQQHSLGLRMFVICDLILGSMILAVLPETQSTNFQYLRIEGPEHTATVLNQTAYLRCQLKFAAVNQTQSGANFLPILSSLQRKHNLWYGSSHGSLRSLSKFVVQWMKDGFGYDNESLMNTFHGRYQMTGLHQNGDYSLAIRNTQLEDEGEYACQVTVSTIPIQLDPDVATSTSMTIGPKSEARSSVESSKMRLIKSETARLTIVVPPKQLNMRRGTFVNGYESPKWEHMTGPLWIQIGQPLQLQCATDGARPIPIIQWTIGDCPVYETDEWSVAPGDTPKLLSPCTSDEWKDRKCCLTVNITTNIESVRWVNGGSFRATSTDAKLKRAEEFLSSPELYLFEAKSNLQVILLNDHFKTLRIGCHFLGAEQLASTIGRSTMESVEHLDGPVSVYALVNLHYLSGVTVLPERFPGRSQLQLVEFHPARFRCRVLEYQPDDSILIYNWSITNATLSAIDTRTSLNAVSSSMDPSSQSLVVHLSRHPETPYLLELLPTRRMHLQTLGCNIQSYLPGLPIEDQRAVSETAFFQLTVTYGPVISGPLLEYVAVDLDESSTHTTPPVINIEEVRDEWDTQFVWLTCETDSNPPATVTWFENLPNNTIQYLGQGEKFRLTVSTHVNPPPRLVEILASQHMPFSELDLSDQFKQHDRKTWETAILRKLRNFTCESQVPGFNKQTATKLVGTAGKPVIIGARNIRARIGARVVITCNIWGLPPLKEKEVFWSFHKTTLDPEGAPMVDMQEEQNSERTKCFWRVQNVKLTLGWLSTLEIEEVRNEHFGLYNCCARNTHGSTWHLVMLLHQQQIASTHWLTAENLVHMFIALLLITVVTATLYLIFIHKTFDSKVGSGHLVSYLRKPNYKINAKRKGNLSVKQSIHKNCVQTDAENCQSLHIINNEFDSPLQMDGVITNNHILRCPNADLMQLRQLPPQRSFLHRKTPDETQCKFSTLSKEKASLSKKTLACSNVSSNPSYTGLRLPPMKRATMDALLKQQPISAPGHPSSQAFRRSLRSQYSSLNHCAPSNALTIQAVPLHSSYKWCAKCQHVCGAKHEAKTCEATCIRPVAQPTIFSHIEVNPNVLSTLNSEFAELCDTKLTNTSSLSDQIRIHKR
ncbi:unnamed protein product [Dicrocoelium dendriticum]|nr:unnamed protein product [Dicrocoelium dendriticum]